MKNALPVRISEQRIKHKHSEKDSYNIDVDIFPGHCQKLIRKREHQRDQKQQFINFEDLVGQNSSKHHGNNR